MVFFSFFGVFSKAFGVEIEVFGRWLDKPEPAEMKLDDDTDE